MTPHWKDEDDMDEVKKKTPRRRAPLTLKAVWHNLRRDLLFWWRNR